jgi:hypothetical protein
MPGQRHPASLGHHPPAAVARLPLLTGGRARRALRLTSATWLAATGIALAISALA